MATASGGSAQARARTRYLRFERRFGRSAATAVRATEAPPSEPAKDAGAASINSICSMGIGREYR
jgi:hypothetical protein